MIPLFNELFGWFWIGLGMVVGVWMGIGFRDEAWLGGYGSWARRMVRLGHIAMIALGGLNVLFALSAPRVALFAPWPLVASWAWMAGAVLMPACCFASACNKRLASLFPMPVIALLVGVTITWIGVLAGVMRGTP